MKTLVDNEQRMGLYSIDWDGRDKRNISVFSGIYFYRLKVGIQTITMKLVKIGFSFLNQEGDQYA